MRFYRPPGRVAALTFDLDDTLYDNRPVIQRTMHESLTFMQNYHFSLRELKAVDFCRYREALRQKEPDIYHDVTEWRRRAVEQAMLSAGFTQKEALIGASAVMAHFAQWRSRITVSQENHDTLAKLAEKWPLVAITNGNAEPHRFGLDKYFQFVLRAGPDGRAKPFSDMYHLAAKKLGILPEQILHVGDDLTTDVAGALHSGMKACWINLRGDDLLHLSSGRLLPHLEISRLASLTALI